MIPLQICRSVRVRYSFSLKRKPIKIQTIFDFRPRERARGVGVGWVGGCRENFLEIYGDFPLNFREISRKFQQGWAGSLVTKMICIVSENLWTRPSRDEFYDHTGFVC